MAGSTTCDRSARSCGGTACPGGPELLLLFGRDWNDVARGEIKSVAIEVEWADVPRGGILGNGTLSLKVEDDGAGSVRIVKVSETGTGFGNTMWTPCTPG